MLSEWLSDLPVIRTFKYVDDYLIFTQCDLKMLNLQAAQVLDTFPECLGPLMLTLEMTGKNTIHSQDIRVDFSVGHTCWQYEPSAQEHILRCVGSQ